MIEKHHIVFKSQGGLDFELNYKPLTPYDHRGPKGPHMCRETDLKYKREMQRKLEEILINEFYTEKELIKLLGLKPEQAHRAFRKINKHEHGMKREDIIFRLMGNRNYL